MSDSGSTQFNGKTGTDYSIVNDNDRLAALCQEWLSLDCIALDTEFIRTDTYYPKVGLIQVCDDNHNYLIDPLCITDWSGFAELMKARQVIKILHSCSEDLLVFYAFLDLIPAPVFDTQIAASFMNMGLSFSYQNLVREMLDIDLPKGETRSDWLQRPLTSEQLEYAALDVAYLPEIYRKQSAWLERSERTAWFREECERALSAYDSEVSGDFSEYYLGIKGTWQLSPLELARIRELAQWREQRARQRNKPRNWIIRDQQLLMLAKQNPDSKQALAGLPDINQNFIRYEGESVIRLLRKTSVLPESEAPSVLPGPLTTGQKKKLKLAQQAVQQKAESLALPPELLARKKTLLGVYYCVLDTAVGGEPEADSLPGLPGELQGWRRDILLQDLIRIFSA